MCGFIFSFTKRKISEYNINNANTFIQYRGPTATNKVHLKSADGMHITLLHNLLDISGSTVLQPVSSDGLHLLFNGEIYNYLDIADVLSDTAAVLKYLEKKSKHLPQLDGEFVVVSYSEKTQTLEVLTDPFLTKPLYFGRSDDPSEFACASYPSALTALGFTHLSDAQPNSNYSINLAKGSIAITENYPLHNFDFHQTSFSYDDWCESFIESVRKRALHGGHRPMVALSSGYDSGCISLALKLLDIKFNAYTMPSGENFEIIKKRHEYFGEVLDGNFLINPVNKKEIAFLKTQAEKRIENLTYHHKDGDEYIQMLSDPGSLGTYIIAVAASTNGEIVNLSGSGGDEIYSDYAFKGKKYSMHSEFGGIFPDDLNEFFPWRKFYGDTQRSYLMKEEFVFGAFGIESRYPFLDKNVVGEYLKLDSDLKNRNYKAPLHYFMEKYKFPFELNAKRGFAIRKEPFARRVKKNIKNMFR